MPWEHFEHGADVGVRGRGESPERAFEAAACALFALLAEDLAAVRSDLQVALECEAGNLEELLVAYLNELLFLFDTRRVVFARFEVAIRGGPGRVTLSGIARGEPFDGERHAFTVLPKGATFTSLEVARRGGEWVAQCVVDV